MNFNVYKNCTFFAKIILPCLFLVGCSSDYQWGWYVVNPVNKTGISNWPSNFCDELKSEYFFKIFQYWLYRNN